MAEEVKVSEQNINRKNSSGIRYIDLRAKINCAKPRDNWRC